MFAETTKIELPKTNNGSELKNLILNGLEEIGRGKISKSGSVSVKPSKGLRKIFTTADVEGAVRKTTTGYKLVLDATSGLTVWGWVVLVLLFPIGLLVLLLPLRGLTAKCLVASMVISCVLNRCWKMSTRLPKRKLRSTK